MRHALHYGTPLLALLAGLAAGLIDASAALATLAFAGWLIVQPRLPGQLWLFGALLGSLLLAAHLLPGFTPLPIGPPQDLGGAAPWQLRISPDKAMVAALLLAWWLDQPRTAWRSISLTVLASGASLIFVPLLALAFGVLDWQPKWPALFLPWLLINLGITCLAEELIFRSLLQRELVRRFGAAIGIGLASVLFGAAHLPAGAGFAGLATLAGLGYGLAFHYAGDRLWVAVLLHGAVNSLHILLLTYPLR
ncbi:CPBP family intramembrane metalloprotease [Stutzerimonas decontaminans]|uniref:CPBP family intramembrane metalloprotease n=2 Tax=Stutzerimonas TaxID=2901164 RepID=A0ABX4W1Q0_9GAMM|nr:CPBP family intramembrane glutamic endopeptidase [Stutzerimonas decontaminans]AHY42119.1 peptidase [Stutzerimonas decontaminans]MCQ4244398.1 CPBP family intramembrane metalloprotease [Stutzerimonas decontaminans]PNF86388.1 CPBP family intramembrane metalloprotease [Stutzerimonas decontaminans]